MAASAVLEGNQELGERADDHLLTGGSNVTVQVVDGDLIVTGDDSDNELWIRRTHNVGQYVVVGSTPYQGEPTRINGATEPAFVTGVTGDFRIALGAGNDRLTVQGGLTYWEAGIPEYSYDTPLVIAGSLIITATSGNNRIQLLYLEVADAARIVTGPGDDVFNLRLDVDDGLTVESGAGKDDVRLWGGDIGRDAFVDCGPGEDSVTVVGLVVEEDLLIVTGDDADELTVERAEVGDDAILDTGLGDDIVHIEQLSVLQRAVIRTGPGNDVLAIGRPAFLSPPAEYPGSEFEFGVQAKRASIHSGSGQDLVGLHGSLVDRKVTLRLGFGDDVVSVAENEIGGRLVLAGGYGTDEAFLEANDLGGLKTYGIETVQEGSPEIEIGDYPQLSQARDADPTGEDWAVLRDAADAIYALWAYGFDHVWADSGTGDNDTRDIGPNLDFTLHYTGTWEN